MDNEKNFSVCQFIHQHEAGGILGEEDHKLADIMSDDLYGNISPDMARKIRYIPKLQLLLENGMDVGEALLGIIKYMNQNEIEDFKNAMSRHYPQYLDKLKTIITFQ